jgi:hypothetical protein
MSYVQVPPDSTGKKVHTYQNTLGADIVQTQAVHVVGRDNADYRLNVDVRGSASVRFAEGQPIMSGFGQLKTQHDRALGVYETSLDTYDDLFSVQLSSGGVSEYQPTASSNVLRTTGALGSSVVRTTNRYHYYLPGTANYVKMTLATGDSGKTGNTRRWGAFDANDGVFFELQDTTLNVVLRSTTTGTLVETRVPQSSWNKDKADGTGNSGFHIDLTKVNIFWIDYQWLGAGRVRFGIVEPSGNRLVCHEFENAGANALPYMRTGTLPLRTENFNTSAVGSSSELREVCLAIYCEGTYEDYTFWRAADVDASVTVSDAVSTPIVNLRSVTTINGKHNSVVAYPEKVNVMVEGGSISLTLFQNTSVAGGTWTGLDSSLEISSGGTVTTTNARKFNTVFLGAGVHSLDFTKLFELNDEGIQMNADGTPNVWSFFVKRISSTGTVSVVLNMCYRELW